AKNNENIRYEEEYITNSRGMKLFTCRWLPQNTPPKALIFLCHGYAVECSITMRETGIRLAKAGYAVYGMDYEGHGKSSGLQGYIPNFDDLVGDCSTYFMSVCEKHENKKKLRFLLGESMGGAVALLLHRKEPTYWNGAVLVAPMCKIADEMKPNPIMINILRKLSNIVPKWKIVPTQDIRSNPYCYKGKPRLKTGHELLMVSLDIEKNLNQKECVTCSNLKDANVSLPFLIVHGGDDTVTDPSVSKLLHESASSRDKAFKLYPGMWHALTSGEPPENTELIFSDITAWLDERAAAAAAVGDSRSEMEQKAKHDAIHDKEIANY
ncbi:Caffeoylshikimate esterase, partial [Ananas comosus]